MKHYAIIFLMLVCAIPVMAQQQGTQQQEAELSTRYIFGFALSHESSDVYMTDIQQIDSVKTGEKGILLDRDILSTQLKTYCSDKKLPLTTSMVFVATTPKEAAKLQQQVMKAYKKKEVLWHLIKSEDFTFTKPVS